MTRQSSQYDKTVKIPDAAAARAARHGDCHVPLFAPAGGAEVHLEAGDVLGRLDRRHEREPTLRKVVELS